MNKKGKQDWQLGLGAALVVLGAYIYSQYNLHLLGVIIIIAGIMLIVSRKY